MGRAGGGQGVGARRRWERRETCGHRRLRRPDLRSAERWLWTMARRLAWYGAVDRGHNAGVCGRRMLRGEAGGELWRAASALVLLRLLRLLR